QNWSTPLRPDSRTAASTPTGGPRRIQTQLDIPRIVVEESKSWIRESPDDEVGGKYIGRIHGTLDRAAEDWFERLGALRIEILHHLDCGPNAERTPTYH